MECEIGVYSGLISLETGFLGMPLKGKFRQKIYN